MPVDEIFKKLQQKTEQDLLREATRSTFRAQEKAYTNLGNPSAFLKSKRIATEVIWFFSALAIGFLMAYIFYEVFSIWLPEAKKDLITLLLHSDANFIYLLAAISFAGVYVTRLTIWALALLQ